jgi:hypothetical protein
MKNGKSKGGLVLKREDIKRHTEALFAKLEGDADMRKRFIQDPTGHVAADILSHQLPPQRQSDANRVLFAMLANDGFRQWLDEYESVRNGKQVTQEQFAGDFAAAVVKFGDSDLLRALFKHAADGFGVPGINAEQLVTGPEKSVITAPATPSTSDRTAHSSSNANALQFGDITRVDPAFMRAVIGQMIEHAKALQAQGRLADLDADIR